MECKKVIIELKNERKIELKINWQKNNEFFENYISGDDLDPELWSMFFDEIYDAIISSQIQLNDIRAIYFENCKKCKGENYEKEADFSIGF